MVTLPYADLITFSVTADAPASIKLWIDDHLIVDDENQNPSFRTFLVGVLNVSFLAGISQKVRLDYRQSSAALATSGVSLAWYGNNTAAGNVPANALCATLPPGEAERIAMSDRLVAPPIQWQTYDNPTMGTHVRMPQAVALQATLGYNEGHLSLGNIFVFRRAVPAVTLVGQHSYNGSDFTELTVSAWKGVDCAVTFATTTNNNGSDLFFIARAKGKECGLFSLLVTPQMLWGRAGVISFPTAGVARITTPGFNETVVWATTRPASWPAGNQSDATTWALSLGSGGAVGFSTGAAATDVDVMIAAIDSARVRQAAIVDAWGPELSRLYEPMASVIAWNTMFTPYEGVITPVSRGWDFGSGYVIFDCEKRVER